MKTNRRLYLGRKHGNGPLVMFRWPAKPTVLSHGERFAYVIGPFRTLAGARYMMEHPLCLTVSLAERKARSL